MVSTHGIERLTLLLENLPSAWGRGEHPSWSWSLELLLLLLLLALQGLIFFSWKQRHKTLLSTVIVVFIDSLCYRSKFRTTTFLIRVFSKRRNHLPSYHLTLQLLVLTLLLLLALLLLLLLLCLCFPTFFVHFRKNKHFWLFFLKLIIPWTLISTRWEAAVRTLRILFVDAVPFIIWGWQHWRCIQFSPWIHCILRICTSSLYFSHLMKILIEIILARWFWNIEDRLILLWGQVPWWNLGWTTS